MRLFFSSIEEILNMGLAESFESLTRAITELVDLANSNISVQGILKNVLKGGVFARPSDLLGIFFGKSSLASSLEKVQKLYSKLESSASIFKVVDLVDDLKKITIVHDIDTIRRNFDVISDRGESLIKQVFYFLIVEYFG